jgi:hypothetical protein
LQNEKNTSSNKNESEKLIFDSLSNGIRYNKFISTSFLKSISKIEKNKLKVIDIWVLFTLLIDNNFQTKIISLFTSKIKKNYISIDLIKNSILNHSEALYDSFHQICNLACHFLRNVEDSVRSFGEVIYNCLYITFVGDSQRRSIINSLITHIGSSSVLFNL